MSKYQIGDYLEYPHEKQGIAVYMITRIIRVTYPHTYDLMTIKKSAELSEVGKTWKGISEDTLDRCKKVKLITISQ